MESTTDTLAARAAELQQDINAVWQALGGWTDEPIADVVRGVVSERNESAAALEAMRAERDEASARADLHAQDKANYLSTSIRYLRTLNNIRRAVGFDFEGEWTPAMLDALEGLVERAVADRDTGRESFVHLDEESAAANAKHEAERDTLTAERDAAQAAAASRERMMQSIVASLDETRAERDAVRAQLAGLQAQASELAAEAQRVDAHNAAMGAETVRLVPLDAVDDVLVTDIARFPVKRVNLAGRVVLAVRVPNNAPGLVRHLDEEVRRVFGPRGLVVAMPGPIVEDVRVFRVEPAGAAPKASPAPTPILPVAFPAPADSPPLMFAQPDEPSPAADEGAVDEPTAEHFEVIIDGEPVACCAENERGVQAEAHAPDAFAPVVGRTCGACGIRF